MVDGLVVGDLYIANDSCNLRTQRRKIAPNVSVVRDLFDSSTLPGIPVPHDRK